MQAMFLTLVIVNYWQSPFSLHISFSLSCRESWFLTYWNSIKRIDYRQGTLIITNVFLSNSQLSSLSLKCTLMKDGQENGSGLKDVLTHLGDETQQILGTTPNCDVSTLSIKGKHWNPCYPWHIMKMTSLVDSVQNGSEE